MKTHLAIFLSLLLCGIALAQQAPNSLRPSSLAGPSADGSRAISPVNIGVGKKGIIQGTKNAATNWTYEKKGDVYAVVGEDSDHKMAMVTSEVTPHFALVFAYKGKNKENVDSSKISVNFQNGGDFYFNVKHSYAPKTQINLYSTLIPDRQVKAWTHDLTALNLATISFPDETEPSWTMSLGGTTSAVTAMANALKSGGIEDLPPPWTSDGNVATKSSQSMKGSLSQEKTAENSATSPAAPFTTEFPSGGIQMMPLAPPSALADSAAGSSNTRPSVAPEAQDSQTPAASTDAAGQDGGGGDGGIFVVLLLICAVAAGVLIRGFYKRRRLKEVEDKIKSIIFQHIDTLTVRRGQLIRKDPYGKLIFDSWIKEIQYFVQTQIIPKLLPYEAQTASSILIGIPMFIEHITNERQAENPVFQEFDDDMDPASFEFFCARQLEIAGWDARVTMRSRDQGIDVVAEKHGKKFVLQCKLYANPVGNKAVQEISAGRAHERADYAAVVTNNRYTSSAEELANTNGVLLLHFSQLRDIDSYLVTKPAVDIRNSV